MFWTIVLAILFVCALPYIIWLSGAFIYWVGCGLFWLYRSIKENKKAQDNICSSLKSLNKFINSLPAFVLCCFGVSIFLLFTFFIGRM